MAHADWQKKCFPDVAAARHAMPEPGLIDMPRNAVGMATSPICRGKVCSKTSARLLC
jgi:hypothetical protein